MEASQVVGDPRESTELKGPGARGRLTAGVLRMRMPPQVRVAGDREQGKCQEKPGDRRGLLVV